ncbi:hypothetical protein KC866_01535 [Patescibacteria group bacterium]|nr:hypothetical protein [Patescibacteria group bacterium]
MQYSPTQKNNRGFAILFSVLISAIILLISSGIFNVVQKEVILSSYARESQRAFYAVDSALECALYADIVGVNSPPATPFSVVAPADATFDCGGDTITSSYLSSSGGTQDYEYPFVFRYYNTYNTADHSCAYVLVEKNERSTDLTVVETRMTAVGFNTCVDSAGVYSGDVNIPDFNDPTLLERRLTTTYSQ